MKISIKEEQFSTELLEEMRPLFYYSYNEMDESGLPYNPDFDVYLAAKDSAVIFTLRDEEEGNTLAGYSFYFVTQNLHSKFFKTACCGSLYVLPPYRFYSLKFMKYNFDRLHNIHGVTDITLTIRTKFEKVMQKLGFKETGRVYTLTR